MEFVMPEFGLFFWMVLSFSLLLIILKKYAWKPILSAIAERESLIENALLSAERAKTEMLKLQNSNENLLKQAILEREKILKETREMREMMLNDAKNQSKIEAYRLIEDAREAIEMEKTEAIADIQRIVSTFSIDIAEKLLNDHLSNSENQKKLIRNHIEMIKTLN